MRILFADGLADSAIDRLRAAGDDCEVRPELTADDLPEHIAGFDALVVRSTKVTGATIDAATNLALIVRAGAGTNTIDCDRAAEMGIFVCNVPGRNAVAVAELAMGLLLAVDRHIAAGTADLRTGTWNKKAYSKANGILGSTMGIIGLGSIGLETASRASAFGMRVVAEHRDNRRPDIAHRMAEIGIESVPDRAALLAESDVVSIHVPGGDSTAGMVDAKFLAAMKPNAVLINTSRGETMIEGDLIAALDSTDLHVGLDVYPNEPAGGTGDFDSPLAHHPKVTGTHHVGASTNQAQMAVADGTVELLEAYRNGSVLDCVNLEKAPRRTATLLIRHHDRVGVLASILQDLRSHDVNVANMSNRIFAGSKAAVATIEVAGVVDETLLESIMKLPNVINLSVIEA